MKILNVKNHSGKGINNITYTYLDLPQLIETVNGNMTILYDASGKKHGQISSQGNYGYLGGVVTKDGALEGLYFAHGRVVPDAESENGYRFEYTIQDHLGNNRVFFSDKNQDGELQKTEEILKESHYYPFGMDMEGDWVGSMRPPEGFGPEYVNRFNYNGKELTDELGIDMYDYGARWYDPSIARWNAVDPMADQRSWVSPYNYVQNNPLIRIDPDGRLDNPIYGEDGTFLGTDDKGLRGEAIIMNENDFTDGMSHDEAMSKGTTLSSACESDCVSSEVHDRVSESHGRINAILDNFDGTIEGTVLRKASLASYTAAGVSAIPISKSLLAKTPSWFHGGYGRSFIKGSKYTSVASFGYRRLAGGGNAGRAIPGILGGLGTGLLWGDAMLTGMRYETDAQINSMYDANNKNNPYKGFVFRGFHLFTVDRSDK